jgi:hypothetical protein
VAKPVGKISMLPEAVRTQINHKIRDGWKYRTITDWLFVQRADQDVPDLNLKTGELYALAWTQVAKNDRQAHQTCAVALTRWFKYSYQAWLNEELVRDQMIRFVEATERLNSAASEKSQPASSAGGNLIIRSLLMEAIRGLCGKKKTPADLARLANAWARMNDTSIRGQAAIDAGLQSLRDEIKTNPEALELFNKLYGALKGRRARTP